MKWLKNAFAIEDPGAFEPTNHQKEVVEKVCREVARRHLVTPALLFLEMSRPLNYIGSQAMQFFSPIVGVVLDTRGYRAFADFLEHRGSIDYMCRRLEDLEGECSSKERHDAEADSGEAG